MISAYKKGSTISDLAAKYICSRGTILKILKAYKVPIRDYQKTRYKGKRTVVPGGYLLVTIYGEDKKLLNASGSILEHRLIMARHLGRKLFKHEQVHHKNGDRQDNRLENLELWSKSQPCGQRVTDKIKWARELLLEYGYKVIKK